MQGTLHIIPANPTMPLRTVRLDRPVTHREIREAVGGSLRVIPDFDTVIHDGRIQLCYAFCDEDGRRRDRPPNRGATALWSYARVRRFGYDRPETNEILVGSIALLTGDTEFMQAM